LADTVITGGTASTIGVAVMLCGAAEEPRKLLPSLSVAVTVHVPELAVIVTTPLVTEHDPLALKVRIPSPVVSRQACRFR
jgi:hypothetical protein